MKGDDVKNKSTQSSFRREGAIGKHPKPRPDFPLFPHDSGRWAKKIRGKFAYFGRIAGDPLGEAALQEYLDNKEDLHAGRTPQRDKEALTLRELCNRFLNSKRLEMEAGKLSPRTFIDYERVCRRLAEKSRI